MPRPITKKDIDFWKTVWGSSLKVSKHEVLGFIVSLPLYCSYCCSYSVVGKEGEATPKWVNRKTLEKRKKLGFPQKRRMKPKQMLRDGPFSLDEMAIAEAIINGG